MKKNIKELFNKIDHGQKYEVIDTISKMCGITFGSAKSNWLSNSGGWSVPEEHQATVVDILQKAVKLQNYAKKIDVKID